MTKKNTTVKVLQISSGDLWAGAEMQLFTLANALRKNTNTIVTIILFNHGELEKKLLENDFQVIILDESKLNGIQILKRLINIIRRTQPDMIHTHRTKENILGSFAALFSGNIPSIRTAHGAAEFQLAWYQIPKYLIHFLNNFCARVLQKKIIAVSDDLAQILKKDFPEDKIQVIENGIDIEILIKNKKADSNITNNALTPTKIGIAGRLVSVKRVDLFIEAAAALLNKHPKLNVSFHIFGDGPLRTELEAMADKYNTKTAIHFEGHCENMQQALTNLDILLITSDHEGLPMILLEAMALQVPVIAHAVGGIPRVLDQGNCGVLVSDHKPAAYADAIHALATMPETRRQLSSMAFDRVKRFYASEINAKAYHATYQRLIQ